MIITEFYETRDDGIKLYRTYSNTDMRIRQDQTGAVYDEAIDVENSGYTYTETDEPIEEETTPEGEDEEDDADFSGAVKRLLADEVIELAVEDEPDYFSENEEEPNYFA